MSFDGSSAVPTREAIDSSVRPLLLEFGTDWCGFCQAAEPLIVKAIAEFPSLDRINVEDGPGRPLGRSYRIKLWPTLIFLQNGVEKVRLVHPQTTDEITAAIRTIV